MNKSILDTIGEVPVFLFSNETGDEIVRFLSDGDIDGDGSGPKTPGDTYIPDTTLHRGGRPLNSREESFVVVPPIVCQKTRGKVLGSFCLVENTLTNQICTAVVGDIGPHTKTGEMSIACAKQLGVNPDPVHGGESRKIIRYTIFVGVPAVAFGWRYELQTYGRSA